MIRDESIPERIRRLRGHLESIKSAQLITGDSWVVYKYTGTWDTSAGNVKYLVFRSFNPEIQAVVKLSMEATFYMYPLGVRSQNGVYMWVLPPWFTNQPYIIDSTQPGSVEVVSTPVF